MEIYISVLGLIVGSFLNVLIDRLPKGQNVLWGRSHCDYCKKTLRWYELIPVFSYILQGGDCRRCRKSLSVQYPVIELLTAAGYGYLFVQFQSSPLVYIVSVLLFSSFLVLFVADMKYQILPDSMILTGMVGTVAWILSQVSSQDVLNHIVSSAAAGLFFYVLWFFTKGKGMGFGDVKLAVLVGLLIGSPGIIAALYIAFLTGAFAGVILILQGNKSMKSKIAFGPFIIVGMSGWILFHVQIMNLWQMFI